MIPMLAEMGVLTVADGNALERYCDAMVRWRKLSQVLNEKGEIFPIKDNEGKVKCVQQMPHVSIVSGLAALLANLEAQFGMTPSARSGLAIANAKEKPDIIAQLIAQSKAPTN